MSDYSEGLKRYERAVRSEMSNVAHNYPMDPAEFISRRTADECYVRGWITRQRDGKYIPTAEGLREYWSVRA